MPLVNARDGDIVRATRAYRFFGGTRETVERAYAGDIIGLPNPGKFAIGDTLYAGDAVRFPPVPRFAAEHFGRARLLDTRGKQFDVGVRQLEEEGLMQVVFTPGGRREPILCVVGPLQLDIVEARLRQEYGVDCKVESLSFSALRWVRGDAAALAKLELPFGGVTQATDRDDRPVLLFESAWHLTYTERQNPALEFASVA